MFTLSGFITPNVIRAITRQLRISAAYCLPPARHTGSSRFPRAMPALCLYGAPANRSRQFAGLVVRRLRAALARSARGYPGSAGMIYGRHPF